MREKVFEHLLLAELGLELMARGVEFEVLHGETDRDGHDVVMEAGGVLRHMQLKVTVLGGARSDITVNTRLAAKPAACVVWLTFDPATRNFSGIRWLGGRPGTPLPGLGDKVARHSRANTDGVKGYRPGHRVIPAGRFDRLDDVGHLADRLFGMQPVDPTDFLLSRMDRSVPAEPAWLDNVLDGDFAAIPADISWTDGAPLASLVDGYRLLQLLGDEDKQAFLDRQRHTQQVTGIWPGDVVTLWTTLFMEARADHFGANDFTNELPHLDLLCRQLRDALIELDIKVLSV
jgi:hypothetical protein